MKALNILLKISLAAVIFAAFTFGCENITNPEPISSIDSTKTATIQGTATAIFDLTTFDVEPAQAGTKVKVVIDSQQFVSSPQPGVQYQNLTYTTTLDADGNFSIEVPALDGSTQTTIYFDSFKANQVQGDGTEEETTFTPTPNPINLPQFMGGNQITVVAGLTTILPNIAYN